MQLSKAMEKCSALQAEVTLGQKSIESMAQHIRVLENEIDRLKEKNARYLKLVTSRGVK